MRQLIDSFEFEIQLVHTRGGLRDLKCHPGDFPERCRL